jgi:hypothetical protein
LAHDWELYTDAAGSLGCGAYFQGAWFHYDWQPHQLAHSIQWKELFAIALTCFSRQQGGISISPCNTYVLGTTNTITDALPRMHFHTFLSLAPQANKVPTVTPGMLTTF